MPARLGRLVLNNTPGGRLPENRGADGHLCRIVPLPPARLRFHSYGGYRLACRHYPIQKLSTGSSCCCIHDSSVQVGELQRTQYAGEEKRRQARAAHKLSNY